MPAYDILRAKLVPGWRATRRSGVSVRDGRMQGYLSSTPVDARAWKNPPHVALANLGYVVGKPRAAASDGEVREFLLTYGALGLNVTDSSELFMYELWAFREHQIFLRRGWEERRPELFTDTDIDVGPNYWRVSWEVGRRGVQLRVMNGLLYMGILLTRDVAENHAKFCQNKKCAHPYFVSIRTSTMFCSHQCAVAVSIERYRKRRKS